MSRTAHIKLMADYNGWMNAKLYDAAKTLPAAELIVDRNAFFGSIFGTLNHLIVADTIWLKRFVTHPAQYSALVRLRDTPMPGSLREPQSDHLDVLAETRQQLDEVIVAWAASIEEPDLDKTFVYANTRGHVWHKNFFSVVMHFFNHQTHHRGQASTLLFQAGVDVGVTDLVAIIPDESSRD